MEHLLVCPQMGQAEEDLAEFNNTASHCFSYWLGCTDPVLGHTKKKYVSQMPIDISDKTHLAYSM